MIKKYVRNILYLLPTKDWSTKERFAFRDMLLAKKHGYNIYLCTYEDSFLARIAKKLDIEIIPYKEHFINRILVFHKHFPISRVKKYAKFDIFHCYDFNLLFSLSFQLKRESFTSLVITQDHFVDKPLQKFWYRPLISRIDSLIIINKKLKQDAIGNLGLPLKKIEYFGMGLKLDQPPEAENIAINFELYKEYFLAGTYVSPEDTDIETLTPIFSALKVLNEKIPGGKRSKLVLISAVEFQSITILHKIMSTIKELELQDDVIFVTTQDIVKIISYLNVWVSNCPQGLIEDFALSALMLEVPAIFIKNFCTKDLIEEYMGVGETYKLYDARELRDKWEKIILANAFYKEKTRLYKYFIEKEHSYKYYKIQLLNLYTRTVQKRARLFRKT